MDVNTFKDYSIELANKYNQKLKNGEPVFRNDILRDLGFDQIPKDDCIFSDGEWVPSFNVRNYVDGVIYDKIF